MTAHAGHRATALRDRVGGFAVTTWAALEDDPSLAAPYRARRRGRPARAPAPARRSPSGCPGDGWTHLAWGGAELDLARRVLAWELDLRAPLADTYRALRAAAGGPAAPRRAPSAATRSPRSSAAPARSRARAPSPAGCCACSRSSASSRSPTRSPSRVPAPAGRTELERSPAFRAYAERLRAGLAFLDSLESGARGARKGGVTAHRRGVLERTSGLTGAHGPIMDMRRTGLRDPGRDSSREGKHMRVTRSALAAVVAGAVLASGAPALGAVNSDDRRHGLPDRDVRKGKLQPTAAQRADARSLGAQVAWNQFGTPSSIVDSGGALATGVQGDTPAAAARAWLDANKQLFKLSSTEGLELVSAAPLSGDVGHAVTLRQTVGGLKASGGGLVTIGVKRADGWSVISAAGTIHGDETLAGEAVARRRAGGPEGRRERGRAALAGADRPAREAQRRLQGVPVRRRRRRPARQGGGVPDARRVRARVRDDRDATRRAPSRPRTACSSTAAAARSSRARASSTRRRTRRHSPRR